MTATLSRRGYVGIAKETTPGTYVAPTFFFPASNIVAEDVYNPIRDESFRNNDTVLQGEYQGTGDSTFNFDLLGYYDALPHLLRAIIGPDTVTTAGVSTTLASNSAVNAVSLSLTASVASNSTIQISDTGGANLEWVQVGTVTGAGPYTAPVTVGGGTGGNSTRFAHTAVGGSVISQSTHSFAQSPTAAQASYSLTKFDVVGNIGATHTRGFAGCKLSELGIKIDPKAALTAAPKWIGFPSATQPDPTPTFSQVQPWLGWQWTYTNGGASSTRGLTYDLTLKRATEAIHAGTGTQAPREVFQAGFESDGTLKAIFENENDLNLFLAYTQSPAVAVLTQPATSGGGVLTLTNSKAAFHKGVTDWTTPYMTASFDLSAVFNSTDVGAMAATLTNYTSTAY